MAPRTMAIDTQPIFIESPLRRRWRIINPPGHPPLAFDLHAVSAIGAPYPFWAIVLHLLAVMPMSLCYSWSTTVHAPVEGKVIACHDDAGDRRYGNLFFDLLRLAIVRPPPGSAFERYGGNHVLIESRGFYVLLAHLRHGSVKVSVGDDVRVGDEIGLVGNSGSSIQPHLHVQVMSTPDLFPLFANLVPFRLSASPRTGRF